MKLANLFKVFAFVWLVGIGSGITGCADQIMAPKPDETTTRDTNSVRIKFGQILVNNGDVFDIEPNTTVNIFDSTFGTVSSTTIRFFDTGEVFFARQAAHWYPYVSGQHMVSVKVQRTNPDRLDSVYFYFRMRPGSGSTAKGEQMIKLSSLYLLSNGKYEQDFGFNANWKPQTGLASKWFWVMDGQEWKGNLIDTNVYSIVNGIKYFRVRMQLWDTVAAIQYGSWYDSTVHPSNWNYCAIDSSQWYVGGTVRKMVIVNKDGEWYKFGTQSIVRPGTIGDSGPIWIHRLDQTTTTVKEYFNMTYRRYGNGMNPFVRIWYNNAWRSISELPPGAVVQSGYYLSTGFYLVELTKSFINTAFPDGYVRWQFGTDGVEAAYWGSMYYQNTSPYGEHLKEFLALTN